MCYIRNQVTKALLGEDWVSAQIIKCEPIIPTAEANSGSRQLLVLPANPFKRNGQRNQKKYRYEAVFKGLIPPRATGYCICTAR